MEQAERMRFAVVGDPIEHSLSPEVHLPVLCQFCKDVSYEKVHVKLSELDEWIDRVRRDEIDGFNVTMPLKSAIIPLLDRIEGDAGIFQSVNTVVNKNGRLYGYNTDGEGFSLSLLDKGFKLKDSNILLLGGGGAARTIALKAALEGAGQIIILGRTVCKVLEICSEVRKCNKKVKIRYGNLEDIVDHAKATHILINATPLGMTGVPDDFEQLEFLNKLPHEVLVMDLVYEPPATRLLIRAKDQGLNTLNGLEMLIYQGILADRLFLNMDLDLSSLHKSIIKRLEGKVGRI
ncbi:MAG: shikimate dehydrogenase [Eubacteriales bacterium]|nr:shikimate dehydrogenase [Eubacteriales bacterium]